MLKDGADPAVFGPESIGKADPVSVAAFGLERQIVRDRVSRRLSVRPTITHLEQRGIWLGSAGEGKTSMLLGDLGPLVSSVPRFSQRPGDETTELKSRDDAGHAVLLARGPAGRGRAGEFEYLS